MLSYLFNNDISHVKPVIYGVDVLYSMISDCESIIVSWTLLTVSRNAM